MKRFALCLLLAWSCSALFAQTETDTIGPVFIPIVTYWNVGDTFRYEVTEGAKNFQDGVLKDSTEKQYKMTLVVSEATDTSYVVRVFRDTDWAEISQFLSESKIKVKDLKGLIEILDFEYLEYVIDKVGAFVEIRNLDKLEQAASLILDKYVEAQYELGEKREEAKEVLSKMKSANLFKTEFSSKIMVMHKFYGQQYEKDSVWYFDYKYPNPFVPGDTILYQNSLIASIPDEWGGAIRLQNDVLVEGEGALALSIGFYSEEEIRAKTGGFFDENPPRFELYINYAISPNSGKLFAMYFETSVFWGEQKRYEKFYLMKSVGD